MAPTVVVIAAGEMGSAVGQRLGQNGARVLTSLAGRSKASAERAARAGMTVVGADGELVASADFVLSIVPPGEAVALAERLAGPLAKPARKPLYVDCNAISPGRMEEVAAALKPSGCAIVDAGIIGPPPREGTKGPRFYASGSGAADFADLRDYGLDIRPLDGILGTASALKCAYASLTKGLTALGAAMALGATRAEIAAPLRAELGASQAELLAYLDRQVLAMYPKAYRWVAEMEEIADYLEGDPAAQEIYRGMAKLYERLARAHRERGGEIAALDAFLARGA